uniref:Uncharacterized protein n=1 Tax=Roseihalotalea indica TaxID=2867963 RepID=A0AA49JE93_9BACT|nr:hypothetical protein K4G66_31890 [Tunicatimonas sp. TK19036]
MNLILTLASGYNFHQLKPFFKTLQSTSYSGDIVVFGHALTSHTIQQIEAHNARVVLYEKDHPYIHKIAKSQVKNPGQYLYPNSLRYFLYQAYLKEHKGEYDQVMHTDIRDVIFQKNPFDYPYQDGVYFFLEHTTTKLGSSQHNSYWIQHGFGQKVLDQMKDETISCSGVTIADYDSFMDYLSKMTNHLCKIPDTGGMDQGIHNYMLRNNQLSKFHTVPDDSGTVSTISTFKPFKCIKLGNHNTVVNQNGALINIVHQYDRHWGLLWRYNKREYFKRRTDLLKQFLLAVKKAKKVKRSHLKNLKSILFSPMLKKYTWE